MDRCEGQSGHHGQASGADERIAVIAVHGVGSQAQHVTAREIAGLLQRANGGIYSEFDESVLEIAVDRPQVDSRTRPGTRNEGAGAPWYVRTPLARIQAEQSLDEQQCTAGRDLPEARDDIRFTREALAGVRVDVELSRYDTRLFSGVRSGAGAVRRVDVFEMYWADLSHLGGWIGQVLGQFYQLLFHLVSLGQKTVELAWVNGGDEERRRLRRVLKMHTLIEWLLAGVIPVGNIALLLVILPALVVLLPDGKDRDGACAIVVGIAIGLFVAAAICRYAWCAAKVSPASLVGRLCGALIAGVAVGVLAGRWLESIHLRVLDPSTALFASISVVCAGALVMVGSRFGGHRRTADGWRSSLTAPTVTAWACLAAWAVVLPASLHEFRHDRVDVAILFSSLRVAEAIFLLLQLAWTAFVPIAWAACLFGAWAAWFSPRARRDLRAAIWTGKIGIFVPATFFLLATLVIWSALIEKLRPLLPAGENYASLFAWLPKWASIYVGCGDATSLGSCMGRLLEVSASPGFNLFVLSLAPAVVLALMAVLPSVVHESRPRNDCVPAQSFALGTWLDSGFALLRIAGYVNLVALLIVLPGVALGVQSVPVLQDLLGRFGEASVLRSVTGYVLMAVGIGVIFRNALFDGFGKALDIALDVDNWLTERPLASNPRGRILARYLALLARVRAGGYSKIVIVSHSQGTVITADLFRYLHATGTLANWRLPPVTLLTFGSPLRQLYGLRFPHLYGWARGDAVSPDVPSVAELGIRRWVNGYRSGDYVGRNFWTAINPWQPRDGVPDQAPVAASEEFCVGAGAHTHYFDATGRVVGQAIDRELVG